MQMNRSFEGGEMKHPVSGDGSMVTRFALWAGHLRGAKKRGVQAAMVVVPLVCGTAIVVAIFALMSHLANSAK
jgi:hypothetical protein